MHAYAHTHTYAYTSKCTFMVSSINVTFWIGLDWFVGLATHFGVLPFTNFANIVPLMFLLLDNYWPLKFQEYQALSWSYKYNVVNNECEVNFEEYP
jgi:hypothetical protein